VPLSTDFHRFRVRVMVGLVAALVLSGASGRGTVLWEHFGTIHVQDNGAGKDILDGAITPQGTNSSSTLYFKFRVVPLSDSATKSIADFEAGLVLVEKGVEHLGIGSTHIAWAYCAWNVPKSQKGYVDLNSARPELPFNWEYMRASIPKYIAFKVEYVRGHDARVTVWLNPDLSLGATEINQPQNITTTFEAKATFDEVHLLHRGGNGAGGWDFSQMVIGTSFEDLLVRHFWQRWWFFALIAVGSLAAVVVMVQLVERRRAHVQIALLERERAVATERTRIAQDIHDEVGTSLTKISKLIEMIHQQPGAEKSNGDLTNAIALTARNTIQAMDEIVWAINPKNDTLKEMADYLVYFTEDFLRPTGVGCTLDVPLKLPDIPITAETRHNLFMAVKEGLNNAVKHASAREIRFTLNYAAGVLTVEIADNGAGFVVGESLIGNGLQNMRRRMNAVGGELQLQSKPGQGTVVKLRVALSEAKLTAQ
jgi:signal transduction histidine kinase